MLLLLVVVGESVVRDKGLGGRDERRHGNLCESNGTNASSMLGVFH